jgi:hypothetical protein
MLALSFLWSTSFLARAQGGWSAWVYHPANGGVTQIRDTGQVARAFTLPLPQAFNRYGDFASFSQDGRYIAYTAYDSTAERPNVQLFVYDLSLDSIRFAYDVTDAEMSTDDLNPIPVVFHEPSQGLAFSFATSDSWQVVLGDLLSGGILAALTSADKPEFAGTATRLPLVRRYDGQSGRVWFTLVDESGGDNSGFQWASTSGDVIADSTFTHVASAFDPFSGQVAALVAAPDSADSSLINTVELVRADGERPTLYTEGDGEIRRVIWIESGARLLIETYRADAAADTQQTAYKVVNRDGTLGGEIIGSLGSLAGTPDGFIGMFTTGDGAPALARIRTETQDGAINQPETLWSGAAGESVVLLGVVPG